ncbi:MAG: heavy-metal-associated domain-containing protein [Dehalococcoidia bacterium]|nr:heavy-metal-associated domain-containing protein [Dehalococcoidia bacterium]
MAQTIQFNIEGMTCDHCVRAVTTALKDTPGVTAATVSLESKSAVVEGDNIDIQKAIEAVAEEGYTASVK